MDWTFIFYFTCAVILYEGLELRQDLAQHGVLPHVDWLEADRRGPGQRHLDKQTLLRLLGLVQDIFNVDNEGGAELSLGAKLYSEYRTSHNAHLQAILRSLKTDDVNTALICTALAVPVLENKLEPVFVKFRHRSGCLEGRHLTHNIVHWSLDICCLNKQLLSEFPSLFWLSGLRVMMIFITVSWHLPAQADHWSWVRAGERQ